MSEKFSGVLCAVQSCTASKRSHPHRRFFVFPSNKILFDAWLDKCGLTKTNLLRRLKVCEKHFKTECMGKRKLMKNTVPEYYLIDPDIRCEADLPTIKVECDNFINSQTLNDSLSMTEEIEPVIAINKKDNESASSLNENATKCFQTNCTERFAKMMKYYKDEIKFLRSEVVNLQKYKSENSPITSLPNLSSAAKEFGKMILNDSTRVWPCLKCMEDIQVAMKLKNKFDDKSKVEVKKIIEEPKINLELEHNKISDINAEMVILTAGQFEESPRDLDPVCMKSENDGGDQPLLEQFMGSGTDKYECEKCKEKHNSYKQLLYHMRFHKDINIYECERCGKEFHKGSKYRNHARIYKSEKPAICKICRKGFKCSNHLRQHELTHKTEKIHKCPHCNKWFCHKKGLNQHLVNHKEKQIKCTKCDKKFQYKSQLRIHNELVHEPKADKEGSSETNKHVNKTLQKQCACEKCGKLFATEISLKFHIKCIHNRVRPFPCAYCNKSFSISTSLKCHIQHHINSKNTKMDSKTIESYLKYKCDECDKAFTTSIFLKNHKILHSGSKDHVCTHCGKVFAFKWYLDRHVRLVHDTTHPRNFVCSICRKVSANIWALKSHMLSHTGETPFHCKFCDSKFRYKKSLRIHMNNKHKSKKI